MFVCVHCAHSVAKLTDTPRYCQYCYYFSLFYVQLLGAGADPNDGGFHHFPPLSIAADSESNPNSVLVVRSLLRKGADPGTFCWKGYLPLHRACAASGDMLIVEELLNAGTPVASPCPGEHFHLPLYFAALHGHAQAVRALASAEGCRLDEEDARYRLVKSVAGDIFFTSYSGVFLRLLPSVYALIVTWLLCMGFPLAQVVRGLATQEDAQSSCVLHCFRATPRTGSSVAVEARDIILGRLHFVNLVRRISLVFSSHRIVLAPGELL